MMLRWFLSKQKTFGWLRVKSKEKQIIIVNNNTITLTTTKTVHLVIAGLRLGT